MTWLFKKLLLALLWVYRNLISPLKPATCRYSPSCSTYAVGAVNKYGPFKGGLMAIKRIGRCHPWGGSGYDPVP